MSARILSPRRSAEHGFTSLRRSAEHGFRSLRRSAEHGFTSLRRSAEHGFTLIELMVVLVIIGLLSGTVLLTMSDPRGRISGDIDRFAGRVRAARDSAIIAGKPVALWVSPTAFGFERRAQGQWQAVTDGPLASSDWSGGTQAQLVSATQLRAVFDTVGRADQPLRFKLLRDGREIALRMDLDGKVTSGE